MNTHHFNEKSSSIEYKNLCEILDFRNTNLPDVIAYRFLEDGIHAKTLTSKELYLEVNKLANLISGYIKPQDRVILAAKPGLEYIIGFFACLRAGAIAVPVFPPANTQMAFRLFHIIQDANPSLVLCDKTTTGALKKGIIANRFLPSKFKKMAGLNETYINLFDMLRKAHIPLVSTEQRKKYPAQLARADQRSPQDIAFLQYTSGSTGNPKGVVLTHNNLLDNLKTMKKAVNHQEDGHVFSWLPPYHDMGLIGCIIEPLYANITATHMSPVDFITKPFLWMLNVSKYKCNTIAGPNFSFDLCARKTDSSILHELDLSCLEVAVNGAEPISMKTMDFFYEKFKSAGLKRNVLHPCYGLAEATLMVSSKMYLSEVKVINAKPDPFSQNRVELIDDVISGMKLISSGVPQTNVKIVDPEGHTLRQEDEVGEIWVQGASIGQGYYNNEAETRKTFKNQIKDYEDNQYYLKTGDLGFIHQGELFVCGRIKDLIIINGQNYYPHDFEFAAMSANPHIQKGCVIAFSEKTAVTEQLVLVADLKKNTPAEAYPEIVADMQKAISSGFNLTANAIYLTPPKTIPKTTSGKLQRKKCAELIENNQIKYLYCHRAPITEVGAADQNWLLNILDEPDNRKILLIEKVKNLVADILNLPDLATMDDQTSLFELGIDSLNAAQLADKLQNKLQIIITMGELYSNHKIDKLVNLLLKKIELTSIQKKSAKNYDDFSEEEKEHECSVLQEAILNHYSINAELSKYNLFSSVLFGSDIKREEVLKNIINFIDNNDTLRIKFFKKKDTFKFVYTTLSNYDEYIRWIKVDAKDSRNTLIRNEVLKPIDLTKDLLFKVVIFEYKTGEHEVLYIANHIISDLSSMLMAQQELQYPDNKIKENYCQVIFNNEQKMEYGENFSKKIKEIWTKKLEGLNYLKLQQKDAKRTEIFATKKISLCTKEAMMALTSTYHTTGFIICMGLMSLILNALSANEKIQLLIPLNKRQKHLGGRAQGLFVNNLLICPLIDWNLHFKELCHSLQQEFIDAQANYFPVEKVITEMGITHNYFNLPIVIGYLGEDSSAHLQLNNIGSTNMGLDLMIYYTIDKDSQWNMFINYVDEMFDQEVISQISFCFSKMLNKLLANPRIINRDLYLIFSANKLLHNHSKLMQEKSIEVKTNIESSIIDDCLKLLINLKDNLLKIRRVNNENILLSLGNLGGNKSNISIININEIIKDSPEKKEKILLRLKLAIERIVDHDNSLFKIGLIGSKELMNSDLIINLKEKVMNSNKAKTIFFQTTALGEEYELDLINLIKDMVLEILTEVEV
ncbi:AMP-binding protein [Legionella cardiaca]|uniref:AMP-binding protein n=1 Tax=Legionella cardiaca TaxID=1071983 RepID=A0ABY8ANU6_9GAMM|nr:AMP-binding protein [Legionella cardiaca]WED42134.1 AMP-binding protein [Legionella cardiaca]